MTQVEIAFLEGFATKCAEYGVDPELILEKMAADEEEAGKKDGPVKATLKGAGKGALAGGALGAIPGAVMGGVIGSRAQHSGKGEQLANVLRSALSGAVTTGLPGVATGASLGSIIGANK